MMKTTEKGLYLLGGLGDDDLRWIIYKGKVEKIPPEETLIYEGRTINALYFVLSGSLKVMIGLDEARELAQLSKGAVVGEISFVDSRPPLATVKAIEATKVLAIPRMELTKKLYSDSKFAARFYQGLSLCLANRMRGTIRRLGYGDILEDDGLESDEEPLTENTKDFLALAEAKFNWLIQNLG